MKESILLPESENKEHLQEVGIIKFKQDPIVYYDKAVELSEKGQHFGCLQNMREALRIMELDENAKEFDDYDRRAIQIEIANALSDMGLYSESISDFYKIYSEQTEEGEEILFGLARNYALLDMIPQTTYYLKRGIELGFFEGDESFESLKFDEKRPTLYKISDNDYMINLAKQLMSSSESYFARQILESMPKDSENYAEAQSFLAYLELKSDRPEDSLLFANNALKKNEHDISALSMKIIALDKLGDFVQRDIFIQKAATLEFTNCADYSKLAFCMTQINNNEFTLKFTKKCLEYMPYSKSMGLLYAQALANVGNIQEAKEQMMTMRVVYPDDFTLKYYGRLIAEAEQKTDIRLHIEIPYDIQDSIFNEVESFMMNAKNVNTAIKLLKKDTVMQDYLRFLFQSNNVRQMAHISAYLAQSVEWHPYVEKMLVDPDFSPVVKKESLISYLKFSKQKSFNIVINNMMKTFELKTYKNTRMDVESAYIQVFCTLVFVEEGFERKLNTTYKQILNGLSGSPFCKEDSLSAVMAYKSKIGRLFKDKNNCCEIFNAEPKLVDAYLLILDSVKKLNKIDSRK